MKFVAEDQPLIVIAGPTASGKTALALHLAEQFDGEIVSCDSVAVYREMEIGTAKPSHDERARAPHHMIDIVWPDEAYTAGDYSHQAREALTGITGRRRLPIVAGGTGLYLRALVDGLSPAPPRQQGLRDRLRQRIEKLGPEHGPKHLHRVLTRLDRVAATAIHENDIPKAIRAIEVSLAARRPLTEQWKMGRDVLTGYSILRLGLAPPRERLYERINQRAAEMFDRGLVEETERLLERYGDACRALGSLGYAEAAAVVRGETSREEAVLKAQQGHRNYAKRQGTWFRREREMHWLHGCGGDEEIMRQASELVTRHLRKRE
ncbi:tRNA (adenosine(37)-N6)-dimethylallyltransferase MiaA [Edaphobacter acidisoli]|uniref:tRNA (adenosine(37)-N6)-dimethylallyltransferase MiaA n=1 Tax=Edaphobacter acidisoli TaxID=2040573 RepID=UPI001E4F9487|nr:tRNA (adenosine(37)-N6)-dimethylallyltransferase MiaA [Edaphobacter acidisoli]